MQSLWTLFQWGAVLAVAGNLACGRVARGADESNAKLPQGYVEEAPLPEGYPPPSEVGSVVEKNYPVSRTYSASGSGAFLKCFAYLSAKQHKMTAPVVMEYARTGSESAAPVSRNMPISVERMHFLLEKNSLDDPKQAGPVQVADLPQTQVLSIAHQGEITADVVENARSLLSQRLKERPEIRAAGPIRLLGYNSPMIPREKSFWEIQLPVEAIPKQGEKQPDQQTESRQTKSSAPQ